MKFRLPFIDNGIIQAGIKLLKVLALVLLFYLLQTVVMPHLRIAGVMPNLLMVIIAIMTVSYGKMFAFITGATVGILLEAMGVSTPLFYLIIYPVLAMLWAQLFADMSDVKREMRRIREAQRKSEKMEFKSPYARRKVNIRFRRSSPYDLNAHLRILLNAVMLTLSYELVMMIYIALTGIPITSIHLIRTFNTLVYTASCCLVMFPVRAFLGLYRRKRHLSKESLNRQIGTDRKLLQQVLLVPDEVPDTKKKAFPLFRKSLQQAGAVPASDENTAIQQEKASNGIESVKDDSVTLTDMLQLDEIPVIGVLTKHPTLPRKELTSQNEN